MERWLAAVAMAGGASGGVARLSPLGQFKGGYLYREDKEVQAIWAARQAGGWKGDAGVPGGYRGKTTLPSGRLSPAPSSAPEYFQSLSPEDQQAALAMGYVPGQGYIQLQEKPKSNWTTTPPTKTRPQDNSLLKAIYRASKNTRRFNWIPFPVLPSNNYRNYLYEEIVKEIVPQLGMNLPELREFSF
jgi:hypothetical protein